MTRPYLFPWDSTVFGAAAAVAWYDDETAWGRHPDLTRERAERWWTYRVVEGGWLANSMPGPDGPGQLADARRVYYEVVRDTLSDLHATAREDWFLGDRPGLEPGDVHVDEVA